MSRSPVAAFFAAPAARKRLAIEAAWELMCARLLTLRPASVYSPALGRLVAHDAPFNGAPETDEMDAVAAEIGGVVTRVAGLLPFRARCLQQAIAVRRMLTRRDIPAMVYLGVARARQDRAEADHAAHAWVTVGARVISGDGVLDKFAIVARFA